MWQKLQTGFHHAREIGIRRLCTLGVITICLLIVFAHFFNISKAKSLERARVAARTERVSEMSRLAEMIRWASDGINR